MLHLLPEPYINEIKKEYRNRCLSVICNLISFCLIIFCVGLLPSLIMIRSEKATFEKQSTNSAISISPEEKAPANLFESVVMNGVILLKDQKSMNSKKIDYVLSIKRVGIVLNRISIYKDNETDVVELNGIANNRFDLSQYIKLIDIDGTYLVNDVPASAFTKDKDLDFTLTLKKK